MKAAAIAWRAALTGLLLTTTWQVWQLRRAPAWLQAQVEREGQETRKAALEAIGDTRRDLNARVDRLIDVSQESMQDIARQADTRLQDLTERMARQLTTANATMNAAANSSVGEMAKLRGGVEPLLGPIHNTLDVINENADLLGRCATEDPETGELIGNPDCFANRVIPAMKSVERMANAGEHMAQAVENETPATAAAVRSTSQSAARIADHFAHPVSWVKGVLSTAAQAAIRWFGL